MIGRLAFLKASAAAMASLSVRDLTDGHDEYLWKRDNREYRIVDIALRLLGRDELVLAERDASASIVGHEWYAPELAGLQYTNTSRHPVAVERIVAVVDLFGDGDKLSVTIPNDVLPTKLGAEESLTILLHQPILELNVYGP